MNDACGGLGSCVGEATKVCPESDGNPCTEPRCDAELGSQDNDYCVESPITVSEAENACYKYSCADGVEEEMGISAGNKCGEWVVTEAGCIDHYVCDSQFTDSTDGSHCRPVSKAEGTPCLSEGVGIKAAPGGRGQQAVTQLQPGRHAGHDKPSMQRLALRMQRGVLCRSRVPSGSHGSQSGSGL